MTSTNPAPPQQPHAPPTSLNPDAKALDTLRRSLLSLTSSLQALHRDLAHPPNAAAATAGAAPLPSWSSLQNSFNLLTHHLSTLANHIDESREFTGSAHAYPLPSFPREHEALMVQLLRKKGDVGVEEWVARAAAQADEVVGGDGRGLNEEELVELWDWALSCAGDAARKVPFGIDVTVEEREGEGGAESVRRREGLKRELRVKSAAEEEEEEEGDEEMGGDGDGGDGDAVKMDVDGSAAGEKAEKREGLGKTPEVPMRPLEDILKFMATGADVANGAR